MKENTVKMIDAPAGRIGGYMLVWGEADRRDLQGEFFTPQTDVGLDWYEQRPVLYHHGLDGALKAAVIGVIDTLRPDDTGLWAEAQLDLHKRYVRAVRRLVDLGVLSWSSGSLPHLVDVGEDGRIKCWPIVEGSLTPTPAEPRQTDVQTLKSAYKSLGLDVSRLGIEATDSPNIDEAQQKGEPMTESANTAIKRLPMADEREAIKAGRIEVGSEFDSLDAMDLLHGYMLLRSTKSFHGVSERYSNALSQKVGKTNQSATKADELAFSTQTGFGDEWVPDLWSQQIWHKARQDNTILPLFQTIEMPSNPFELPIEGHRPPSLLRAGNERRGASEPGRGQSDSGQQDRVGQGDAQRQEVGAAGRLQQRAGRRRHDPGAEHLPAAGGTGDRRRHRQRAAQWRHHDIGQRQYQPRPCCAARHSEVPFDERLAPFAVGGQYGQAHQSQRRAEPGKDARGALQNARQIRRATD